LFSSENDEAPDLDAIAQGAGIYALAQAPPLQVVCMALIKSFIL